MGRPRKEFLPKDIEQIKVLARCHCPDSEIAAFIGCGEATLRRHFDTLLKEMREAGKSNIRAKQYELAMKGDRTMLIWVGKQILNQTDRAKLEITREQAIEFLQKDAEQRGLITAGDSQSSEEKTADS